MGLSSNTILHTTGKSEILGILKKLHFKPTYCNEKVIAGKNTINAAFPMVSFSDFPVSELKYRFTYGRYGIGLSKFWARKLKLNPALYVEKQSQLADDYYNQFLTIQTALEENRLDMDWKKGVYNILSYMKNYQGPTPEKLKRQGYDKSTYRFSDEREWRFVPSRKLLESKKIPLYYKGSFFANHKSQCNAKLGQIELPFTLNDINYIIVDKEKEIEEFIKEIKKNHKGLTALESHKICSRIITMTRIQYDF